MAKVKDLLVNGSSRFIGKIYASDQFISQVANGTAPFVVSSSTVVANLNADMTDGLHVHTGRNNEVNKIVRTDGSGYIQTGYINTNVGTENLAISRIFYEYNNDGYIRKMSPSSFFSVLENSGNNISITVAGQNRKLTVGYASNSDKLDNIDSTGFLQNYSQNYGSSISNAVDISPTLTAGLARVHIYNVEVSSVLTGYDFSNKAWQLRFRPSYNDGIYFRSQGTGTSWKKLAFTSDIPTVTNYYWADQLITSSAKSNATPTFGTCYTSNWFRSTGATGWYSESYGGGIRMTDSSWIRTFGNKNFYVEGGNFAVSGNAGIGTTSPSAKLHVVGVNGETLRLSMPDGNYTAGAGPSLSFVHGTNGEMLGWIRGIFNESSQGNRGNLQFATRTSDAAGPEVKMTILHNGNVGIGTTSPGYKLHVAGDIYANGGWLRSSGNTGWYSESYGGGWYMTDSSWVRTYNGKGVVAGGFYHSSYGSSDYVLTSEGGAISKYSFPYYPWKEQWIDMTGYSESYWHPVVTSLPYSGYKRIKVTVQLNSGTKPSWSTHSSGFACNLDLLTTAYGWGTTRGETICLNSTYYFADQNPVGWSQLGNSSHGILLLRGGGKYLVCTDWDSSWTIYNQSVTDYGGTQHEQTCGPYTSWPGIFNGATTKNTIHAHLDGNATTATYAASAGNADTVDGYHASNLWRSDGGVWNPSANITLGASANGQEWSFDISRNGYTGCLWHVWDSSRNTMLSVTPDDGKVRAPYGFVGNLEGTATSASSVAWSNVTGKPINLKAYSGSLSSAGWKILQGNNSSPSIAISYNNSAANWNSGTYSASMVWGCTDTRGLIDCAYNTPKVTFGGCSFGGATDNNPTWYFKLAGTTGTEYNLDTRWSLVGHNHDGKYLRKDTNDSTSYQYEFTKTNDHAIKVGTIRGRAVGSQTGEYIHLYERVAIGSPSGWGSRNAPTYGLATYGGAWLATDTGNVTIGGTNQLASAWGNFNLTVGKDTNKVVIGYLNSSTNGVVVGGHNNALSAWAPLNIAGTTLYFRINETIKATIDSNGNFGIGTTSPGYKLQIAGDSYTTGWSRAANGFYVEGTGVHFTHQGGMGEIDMTSNNEFLWGSSTATLYFNYRAVSRGTTVNNYIWNAGSSSSYASHTLGNLTSMGNQTLHGLTSTCNSGNSASYTQAAVQIREYNFGGAQSDTWGNAPRLAWHWSGRVQAQIGLGGNNHLYISEDGSFSTPCLILHSGNSYVTGGKGVIAGTTITQVSNADYAGYSGYTLSLNSVSLPSSASNSYNTVWCKFATITFNASAWCNAAGYIFFSGGESTDYKGILEYHFRSGQTASELSIAQLYWIVKSHSYASVIAVKTANNIYDFYINNCSSWSTPRIYHFSAYNDRFKWNMGSWSTTKPTAAYTASDIGRVYYATNAGDADTVDSKHASDFATAGHTHDGRYQVISSTTASGITSLAAGSYSSIHISTGSGGTMSFSSTPASGKECHIVIYNSGSSNITITLPSSYRRNVSSITIASGAFGEVNVLNAAGTIYVRAV